MNIDNLNDLNQFLNNLPVNTTVDLLGQDLEAGNFGSAHFVKPNGDVLDVTYTGPVAEGYVSPFEYESN
jgi:hypothetical protein